MADGDRCQPVESLACQRCEVARQRRLAGSEDLGDGMADRVDEIAGQLRIPADERPVLVGTRVVRPDDQALEVVEVRVETAIPCPGHDLAGDVGPHRRVDEQATDPVGAGLRHRADEGALVADDRRIEFELAREVHRAGDHPAGDEADDHVPSARRADRRPSVAPDQQVVADERPVDVERDQADGEHRVGCLDDGHVLMMPDGWLRRFGRALGRSADPGDARQSCKVGQDGAAPTGQCRGDESHDRLTLVGSDLEHRDAIDRQRRR